MATPIIRSLIASPATVQPGQTSQATFDAYDPDARVITLSGQVTDAGGHVSQVTTTLTVGDPLTYALTSTDPGVTITQDPANPARFSVAVA